MVDSTKDKTAELTDEGGLWASPEEGVRLVQSFVGIRSPERRQAVFEYVLDQAKMDSGQRPEQHANHWTRQRSRLRRGSMPRSRRIGLVSRGPRRAAHTAS